MNPLLPVEMVELFDYLQTAPYAISVIIEYNGKLNQTRGVKFKTRVSQDSCVPRFILDVDTA